MKKTLLAVCLFSSTLFSVVAQKKVYADYHGIRLTRALDGEYGEWKYASKLTNNSTGVTQLTYNPDLILENGCHNIASVDYPEAGMQSQFDEANLEYQVLSAKAAGIDGFFVEWGYMDHSSNELLKKLQKVAVKYDFEIGVNVCDGWLMNKNWYPGTREEKVAYFKTCMQYLIDEVFSGSTAPVVNGKPVMYLFHDGFTADEFKAIRSHAYSYPDNYPIQSGDRFPTVLMRVMLEPTLVNGVYTPKSPITQAGATWINTNRVIPTSWMPERIRSGAGVYPRFNRYATADDCVRFLNAFATNVWRAGYPICSGYASPGMDNYGCGGWSSTGKLSYIPRDNGKTYEEMWKFNLQHKDRLHMMYLASWNDYTEGHEIEPTLQHGDRELRTTLLYSNQFKGLPVSDPEPIRLPLRLYELRKKYRFLVKCGYAEISFENKLDLIAEQLGKKGYSEASALIATAEEEMTTELQKIQTTSFRLAESELTITGSKNAAGEYILSNSRTGIKLMNDELRTLLATSHYEGYLCYEYWDDTWGRNTNIVSGCLREPRDKYKYVAQIKDEGVKAWKKARIPLFADNIKYGAESMGSDFSFYGDASQSSKIRNISFEYSLYSLNTQNGITEIKGNQDVFWVSGNYLYISENAQREDDFLLEVYNLTGIPALRKKYSPDTTVIDLAELPGGTFLVSLNSGSGKRVITIIR